MWTGRKNITARYTFQRLVPSPHPEMEGPWQLSKVGEEKTDCSTETFQSSEPAEQPMEYKYTVVWVWCRGWIGARGRLH